MPELRDALNLTFGPDRPSTTCGTGPASITDTVAVVDGTGDVVEFWLERQPCAVGIRTGWGVGIRPIPDLLGRVDAALGGPPPA